MFNENMGRSRNLKWWVMTAAGDVQMVEDLPPHMLHEQLARRAKTSGRKRRSRSPERCDLSPRALCLAALKHR